MPTWHTAPDADAINLVLDPGMAFGTGSHPTTRLCLEWLTEEVAPGVSVLDYGCGSGILAIAAVKLGAGEVTGVDIDEKAVATAADNAANNGVSLHLQVSAKPLAGTFQRVVANILTNPLKMLAPLLAARVAPGGKLALSGVLEAQADEVIAAYAPYIALRVGATTKAGSASKASARNRTCHDPGPLPACATTFRVRPEQLRARRGGCAAASASTPSTPSKPRGRGPRRRHRRGTRPVEPAPPPGVSPASRPRRAPRGRAHAGLRARREDHARALPPIEPSPTSPPTSRSPAQDTRGRSPRRCGRSPAFLLDDPTAPTSPPSGLRGPASRRRHSVRRRPRSSPRRDRGPAEWPAVEPESGPSPAPVFDLPTRRRIPPGPF